MAERKPKVLKNVMLIPWVAPSPPKTTLLAKGEGDGGKAWQQTLIDAAKELFPDGIRQD